MARGRQPGSLRLLCTPQGESGGQAQAAEGGSPCWKAPGHSPGPLAPVKKWIAKDTNGVNQVSVGTCSLSKEAHYKKLP